MFHLLITKYRDTSDDEMNMCIKFCNYLNIPIFVRET